MATYVALLRGINVAGKNIIKMAELRECFDDMGLDHVETYIQSGNVLFESAERSRKKLTDKIEKELSQRFDYDSCVVTLSHGELEQVVELAPEGFGSEPASYRYDVIFLKRALSAEEAMESITTKEGVDRVYQGKRVLYFSRLKAKASQSRMSRITQLPIYQHMTVRNWTTTTKLLELANARGESAWTRGGVPHASDRPPCLS